MTTQVRTRTVCNRCDREDWRDGAEGDVPPLRWAVFTLSYRAPGAGWSGATRRFTRELCPECADAVENFARSAD